MQTQPDLLFVSSTPSFPFIIISWLQSLSIIVNLVEAISGQEMSHEAALLGYNPGLGGCSLIWVIRVCAAGQGMVFWPRCPKQGIQFDLPLY